MKLEAATAARKDIMNSKTLIAFAAVASLGLTQAHAGPDSFIGKKAPNFIMKDLNGKKITNKSLLGRVVILDFWASWCGPCKAASPAMDELYKKYSSKGLVVIGANCMEQGAALASAKKYVAEHKYSYPFTVENDGLARSLEISSIPAFIILGKDGKVANVHVGIPSFDKKAIVSAFEPEITKLLKAK